MQLKVAASEVEKHRNAAAEAEQRAAGLEVRVHQLQVRPAAGPDIPQLSGASAPGNTAGKSSRSPLKSAAESLKQASARAASWAGSPSGLLSSLPADLDKAMLSETGPGLGLPGSPGIAADSELRVQLAGMQERLSSKDRLISSLFVRVNSLQQDTSCNSETPAAPPEASGNSLGGSPRKSARAALGIPEPATGAQLQSCSPACTACVS
jgi:hypothetical protein